MPTTENALSVQPLLVKQFDIVDYQTTWQRMSDFTDARNRETVDELWLLQHSPVFTLGQAGKPEHLLNPHDIPIVKTNRGGQVTYHGPGQLIVYPLLNLHRLKLSVRDLVHSIEQCIIDTLLTYGINSQRREKAPGVYVNDAKIAALGLRIRHGYCFHGLSINVDMDLTPFSWINPCGYEGLAVTQISSLAPSQPGIKDVADKFVEVFCQHFNFSREI